MCLHGPRSRLIQFAHYTHDVTAELLRAGDYIMTRLRALKTISKWRVFERDDCFSSFCRVFEIVSDLSSCYAVS